MLAAPIFALTWLMISFRRLGRVAMDRPVAALLGAVAMVAAGVLSPQEALAAIDPGTLLLLLGMMGMGGVLAADGLLERLADHLATRAGSPRRLLAAVVWGAGALAALLTNDAVCVLGAPLVVALIRRHQLPAAPFLLALATASNTGSVATLVGNPQNMLCAQLGELSYARHLILGVPLAVAALGLNHALLVVRYGPLLSGELRSQPTSALLHPRTPATLTVLLAVVVAYTAGADLAWTAVAGLAALLVLRADLPRERIWAGVDGTVLLFFAGLFVVVEGLSASGLPAAAFTRWPLVPPDSLVHAAQLSTIFLVGSNLVSNVPFILLVRDAIVALPHPALVWELLAIASTFAGNLTLLGSVANIIVAERGQEVGGLSFSEHLAVGAPLTLLSTALAVVWVWAVGPWALA